MSKQLLLKIVAALLSVCVVVGVIVGVVNAVESKNHYISIMSASHGVVTADCNRAKKNDIVNLSCKVDNGYKLEKITANGKVIKDMSFKMPDENILIEATFSTKDYQKGKTEMFDGTAPGNISYFSIYPDGSKHLCSWNLIYKESFLEATAWIEDSSEKEAGALLLLSKEDLGVRSGLNYLPDYTYKIFVGYKAENGSLSPKTTVSIADKDGVIQEKATNEIKTNIEEWNEDNKTVGYKTVIRIPYKLLSFSDKQDAKNSLVLLPGNRTNVLNDMVAEYWLPGEYDSENYLSYPRLIDDNVLQKNKFIDMTEMELEAYRDMGRSLDGVISDGEYFGTKLEDESDNHRITVQANLTKGKNVSMVMEVSSNIAFDETVNAYPGVGQYLFTEIGLGNNDGQKCTMIKANVKGEVENAICAVKSGNAEKDSEYKYKSVIEIWIPKESITDNMTPNKVRLSRLALFSGNKGKGSAPDNIFLVAKWADINNCNITSSGIILLSEVIPPENEIVGLDGTIKSDEYNGTPLTATGSNNRISAVGYITTGKNIRLALKIDSNTAPGKKVNDYPGVGKYLFAELAFGNNDGENGCTFVKANVLGKSTNAKTVVKTTDNGVSAKYRYSSVIEMWIPQSVITNNNNPNKVQITRLVLFSENTTKTKSDNVFLVAKWANINECFLTPDGIKSKSEIKQDEDESIKVPASELKGIDGIISSGEYKGVTLFDSSDSRQVRANGFLTNDNNIRFAVQIDSNENPDKIANSYPGVGQYVFAELGFGNNTGNGDCTLVKVNVIGKAENAATVSKITDNGKSAKYRYTTVIEMLIPKSVITNNTNSNNVQISRFALFSGNKEENPQPDNMFLVAKWAGINDCSITANGIRMATQKQAPADEVEGLDGVINEDEYGGEILETKSSNYQMTLRGYLTSGKNICLGIQINSNSAVGDVLNDYPGISKYLFTEFGFGNNTGNNDCTLIKANVLGQAENADICVNNKDNGKAAEYRYTTTIELWIPKEMVTVNDNPDKVRITRAALFHGLNEDSETNWLVARWASINNCVITSDGIANDITIPDEEAVGLDGVISSGEYGGSIIDSTKGSSDSKDYKLRTQGYITDAQNIRLAIIIDSVKNPKIEVNGSDMWSKYLFTELAFGNNGGETCQVYADVNGRAKNAVTAVKTTDNGVSSEYRYTTVIEVWIPKSVIMDNPTPNMVQFTRCALFHHKYENPANVNETWLVLRNAWNNAGMNNCYITNLGIVESHLLSGMDGKISNNEYSGNTINNNHTITANYKMTMQGKMLKDGNNKNVARLAITIRSKIDPKTHVNNDSMFSENMFAEIALGTHSGIEDHINVWVDVLGKTKNAVSIVKNTVLGENEEYRYVTEIEMFIPNNYITNDDHDDLVFIPRVGLFHQNIDADKETWVVAKWAYLYDWLRVTENGLVN